MEIYKCTDSDGQILALGQNGYSDKIISFDKISMKKIAISDKISTIITYNNQSLLQQNQKFMEVKRWEK